MSEKTPGTFGALLETLHSSGYSDARFHVELGRPETDERRWNAYAWGEKRLGLMGVGRTGEEALRCLCENIPLAT